MLALTFLEAGGMIALSLAVTVLLAVIVLTFAGLFEARSLVRRELAAYFFSPVAYAVLVVFLLVTGALFYLIEEKLTTSSASGLEWPIQLIFGDEKFWLVFLFIPSLLTMRLFAEERASGTLEALMTAPLREWQVVLSKFTACMLFYIFMWLPTLVYLPILLDLGRPQFHNAWTIWSIMLVGGLVAAVAALISFLPRLGTTERLISTGVLGVGIVCALVGGWNHYHLDNQQLLWIPTGIDPMPVLSTYLGVALAGAMFLSIGLLVSSLVRDQIVAAIVTLPINLIFIVAGFWKPTLTSGNLFDEIIKFFSVPLHFSRDFSRGVVDTRHLILYASVAAACLFITIRSLESRRWR
jgi:ABC-2 type transport system permease protein